MVGCAMGCEVDPGQGLGAMTGLWGKRVWSDDWGRVTKQKTLIIWGAIWICIRLVFEIKKPTFGERGLCGLVMLPNQGLLPQVLSAAAGATGSSSVFFWTGLSVASKVRWS